MFAIKVLNIYVFLVVYHVLAFNPGYLLGFIFHICLSMSLKVPFHRLGERPFDTLLGLQRAFVISGQ